MFFLLGGSAKSDSSKSDNKRYVSPENSISSICVNKFINKTRKRKFRIDDLLEEDVIPQKKEYGDTKYNCPEINDAQSKYIIERGISSPSVDNLYEEIAECFPDRKRSVLNLILYGCNYDTKLAKELLIKGASKRLSYAPSCSCHTRYPYYIEQKVATTFNTDAYTSSRLYGNSFYNRSFVSS